MLWLALPVFLAASDRVEAGPGSDRGFLEMVASVETALPSAPQFPYPELQRLSALSGQQAKSAETIFLRARDGGCPQRKPACIDDLNGFSTALEALSKTIEEFSRFSSILQRPEFVSRLSHEEKMRLRKDYSVALKGLVFWVGGLDDILNVKIDGFFNQRKLNAAQDRLQKQLEAFNARRHEFTIQICDIVIGFPVPTKL